MATARVVHTDAGSRAQVEKPSRREFLYYMWGASMALALGGTAAGVAWYMLPRANPDEIVTWELDNLPHPGSTALVRPELRNQWSERFSIAHTYDDSLIALHRVCPYNDCLVRWGIFGDFYECYCCGSRFEIDGTHLYGRAPRSLDRFPMTVTLADGTTATTNEAGDPIAINGREIASVTVDTRRLIERPGRV
jgi:nitrite reductase/ring-hydroxylating ferredoxin subunit